ncbi:hypothetical protein GWK47_023463 [Chionoecetes opilio]|uniref:Uncharacterized protein n=1 Tax=Chionoecetes opilio TaxID=41210 RepID=A0A8J5CD35_CHIOP|nr:hypothetical protein GWK47_023463 [Chionoecetes opilio]
MKMRERKTFPRAFSTTSEECMSDTWAASTVETGVQEGGRRRGGRAIQGQERQFRTTLAAQPLCGQAARNPDRRPWKGGSEARATLGGRLVDSSGPRAKGPRPRAPEPGRPTPTGTTRILGAIHTGVSTPGLPLPTRRAPTNTAGPPPGTPWPRRSGGRSRHQSDGGGD